MGAESESDDKCHVFIAGLHELKEGIDKSVYVSNEPVDTPSVAKPSNADCQVLSSVIVSRKGGHHSSRKFRGLTLQ